MERKEKQVSATATDQAIWEFEQAILKAFPKWQTESEFSRAEYYQRALLSAVQRYIYTARASTEFLRAFINLSSARMLTLARRCWASEDKSDKGITDTIKRYLRLE